MLLKSASTVLISASAGRPATPPFTICDPLPPPGNGGPGGGGNSGGGGSNCVVICDNYPPPGSGSGEGGAREPPCHTVCT